MNDETSRKIISDRPFRDYPLGTKAYASGGGYWIKVKLGWKWHSGATFPEPGGDWNGFVSVPVIEQTANPAGMEDEDGARRD
jgi:hypothetical protein